jgi:hypothetical protein
LLKHGSNLFIYKKKYTIPHLQYDRMIHKLTHIAFTLIFNGLNNMSLPLWSSTKEYINCVAWLNYRVDAEKSYYLAHLLGFSMQARKSIQPYIAKRLGWAMPHCCRSLYELVLLGDFNTIFYLDIHITRRGSNCLFTV